MHYKKNTLGRLWEWILRDNVSSWGFTKLTSPSPKSKPKPISAVISASSHLLLGWDPQVHKNPISHNLSYNQNQLQIYIYLNPGDVQVETPEYNLKGLFAVSEGMPWTVLKVDENLQNSLRL